MTKTIQHVARVADIHTTEDDITDRDAETIAKRLSDGDGPVLWLQPWLMDDKALAYEPGDVSVACVSIERETDKAWCVAQQGEEWIPKSQSVVFRRKDGVGTVASDQQRLGET